MTRIPIHFPYRFRTAEDAAAWSETNNYALTVPPFILEGGLAMLNPDYSSAPYEVSLFWNHEDSVIEPILKRIRASE